VKLEGSQEKVREFLSYTQMNSLVLNRQTYTLHLPTSRKDGSVASFVSQAGQEKYCVFLICSQNKHPHLQEKYQEKSEKY